MPEMVTIGRGMDTDIADAVYDYMNGVAAGQWRARADLRAASEAILGYRVEVDEVMRVLRVWEAEGVIENRRVDLSPIDHDLQRIEYRLRRKP